MGLARIFGLCAALLFVSSVNAAVTIDLGPSEWRSFGPNGAHAGSGIKSSFGQTVRMPPTAGTLNVTRNPVIPYGSIANGLRNFTRINPASVAASAAVTGLFLAMDWAFEDGQWSKPGYDYGPEDPDNIYWVRQGLSDPKFSSPEEMCGFYGETFDSTGVWQLQSTGYELNSNGRSATCFGMFTYQGGSPFQYTTAVGNRVGSTCNAPYVFVPALGACAVQTYVPLDSSDWSDLESSLPSFSPNEVSTAAGDVQRQIGNPLPGYSDTTITGPSSVSGPETTSTSTDPVTGDTIVTNTSTETAISYGDTTITTTDTTTSTTYQNGQETSTTVTTETPGELPATSGGGAGDWPGFCEWASAVCDWFDWTREEPPPEQDLPQVVDDDFYQEKNISFGSKSCPPDHEINLAPFLPTSVAVSFQPLCDFAGLIYYMVMAASYIIAAYITIGVARNG